MRMIKNLSVRGKLLLLTIPLIACIIVTVVYAGVQIGSTAENVTEVYYDMLYTVNNYVLNADRDFYQALVGATQRYELMNGGNASSEELASKLKDYTGNYDQVVERVSAAAKIAATDDELYRSIKAESGLTFKDAADKFLANIKVWDTLYNVEKNTGNWNAFNTTFEESRDLLDDMQEITEVWADQKKDELTQANTRMITISSVIFGVIILVLLTLAITVIREFEKGIREVKRELDELAAGNLALTFPNDDEIADDDVGMIQKSAKHLCAELKKVIARSKNMSVELSGAGANLADSANAVARSSNDVTTAMSEMSKGAVSQAESVEESAGNTSVMGENIEDIALSVKEMDGYAADMKQSCDEAMSALEHLIGHSTEVTQSVKEIGATIHSTNESAKSISKFTQAITAIANQTNLLSLNASIEAARAGEAGKGFAVVATEVSKLADESRVSVEEITAIVNKLLVESAKSVEVLDRLNESFGQQTILLGSTKDDMEKMSRNVSYVKATSGSISERADQLKEAKDRLMEIITDLSAISEENAASSEETSASMEELNGTFELITESATRLQEVASGLEETIRYFRTN